MQITIVRNGETFITGAETANISEDVQHYGVLGMKWGVRRALSRSDANYALAKKATTYDKRAAVYMGKAERIHSQDDLGAANKSAVKSAKYKTKAATLAKRAVKTDNEYKRAKLENKSEKLNYKAAKADIDANQLSKTAGYSNKSLKYVRKADRMAKKAAKARKEMATNQYFIEKTKRKVKSLPPEKREKGRAYINQLSNL